MSDAGEDEHRRLLSLIAMRIDAQVRNAEAIAKTLDIQLAADPGEPVRKDAALATGLSKTEAGLAVDIASLPEASMRDGWLIVQGESGEPRKLSIKTIVAGPYFPGSFGQNTFYDFYEASAHPNVSPMMGSGLAATRNDLWELSGSGKAIWVALDNVDIGVQLFLKLVRTGASKAR